MWLRRCGRRRAGVRHRVPGPAVRREPAAWHQRAGRREDRDRRWRTAATTCLSPSASSNPTTRARPTADRPPRRSSSTTRTWSPSSGRCSRVRRRRASRCTPSPACCRSARPRPNPTLTNLGFRTFYRVISSDVVQGAAAADYVAKVAAGQEGLLARRPQRVRSRPFGVVRGGAAGARRRIRPRRGQPDEGLHLRGDEDHGREPGPASTTPATTPSSRCSRRRCGRRASPANSWPATAPTTTSSSRRPARRTPRAHYLTCACGDANSDPAAAGFVEDYKRVNGGAKPGTYSGEAYDATNAVIDVLRRQGLGATRAVAWSRRSRRSTSRASPSE